MALQSRFRVFKISIEDLTEDFHNVQDITEITERILLFRSTYRFYVYPVKPYDTGGGCGAIAPPLFCLELNFFFMNIRILLTSLPG